MLSVPAVDEHNPTNAATSGPVPHPESVALRFGLCSPWAKHRPPLDPSTGGREGRRHGGPDASGGRVLAGEALVQVADLVLELGGGAGDDGARHDLGDGEGADR